MLVHQRKYTLEEYRAFCDAPENATRLFELIDGEMVEKKGSFKPSAIASEFNFQIKDYLRQNPIGYVTGEAGGYMLAPGYVVMPDVGYIAKARLPEVPEREAPLAPDLAVEIKSPTDSKRELRKKAELYLTHGTKLVWLVFPDEEQIEIYTPDQDVIEIGIDGVLDGSDVLPGFTLAVRSVLG
ncbi:MAG: Uma2 family endonuclease [Anaerolineae bacterium]|nr:Uma2 family endonuclease [Anaerolineae bacterium]